MRINSRAIISWTRSRGLSPSFVSRERRGEEGGARGGPRVQITGAFYPLKRHTPAQRCPVVFAIKSGSTVCLLRVLLRLTSTKVAFPRAAVRALVRSRSQRACAPRSCTRRPPPQRRTIRRIPISLPAFLSPCGRVRHSRSVRWITCVLEKERERTE